MKSFERWYDQKIRTIPVDTRVINLAEEVWNETIKECVRELHKEGYFEAAEYLDEESKKS